MSHIIPPHGARIPWSAADATNDANRTTSATNATPLPVTSVAQVSDSGSVVQPTLDSGATDVASGRDWHAEREDGS